MKRIPPEIVRFFTKQGYVILTTVGPDGVPHSVCKGIVSIRREGELHLLDLYHGATYRNLRRNPRISVAVADEHSFRGFCLKGRGRIVPLAEIGPLVLRSWERKISGRITQRILKNIRGMRGHAHHPEALLPAPKYLIVMSVEEIIDLTPGHVK